MDRTLLVLLAEAWKTGERADVLALVDRIKDAPAEEVVETFLTFRQAATAAAALAAMPGKLAAAVRTMSEVFAPAARALQALGAALQQQATQEEQPQQPGPVP